MPEGESFDLVLANLPYIAEPDWPSLPPEVREWEPREALLAGPDGLDAIPAPCVDRARVRPFATYADTKDDRASRVEVGEGQAAAVGELLRAAGFGSIEVRRDLAGIERVVVGATSAAGEDDR